MWIVALALRRPYTFVVMALVIMLMIPIVILRTPVDIFPDINIPVISVVWNFAGFAPTEMADRIVTNSERGITITVNDIEHIESQSVNGVGVIKIFFRPQANIQTALAQVTAIVQTTVRGAATPYPYGGKIRQVQVDLDIPRLQANGLSPDDIVNALNAQNLITPSGSAKIGPLEYQVQMNSSPQTIAELNDLPVKTVNGSTLYLRDVAHVRDGFAPQTNIVRQDGIRGTLMSIYKIG